MHSYSGVLFFTGTLLACFGLSISFGLAGSWWYEYRGVFYFFSLGIFVYLLYVYCKPPIAYDKISIVFLCMSWGIMWVCSELSLAFDPYHGEPHADVGITMTLWQMKIVKSIWYMSFGSIGASFLAGGIAVIKRQYAGILGILLSSADIWFIFIIKSISQ